VGIVCPIRITRWFQPGSNSRPVWIGVNRKNRNHTHSAPQLWRDWTCRFLQYKPLISSLFCFLHEREGWGDRFEAGRGMRRVKWLGSPGFRRNDYTVGRKGTPDLHHTSNNAFI
jgi:hypothetical protein